MIILNIEDFFHPNAGYQINILTKYMVKRGHETYIATSKIDKVPKYLISFFGEDDIVEADRIYEESTGVKIIRVRVLRFISSRAIFSSDIDKVIKNISPDIIFAHGNDTAIGIKMILKQHRLKTALILDSHMLSMASCNRFSHIFHSFYKKFITPKIIKNKLTVIRTQNDDYVQKYLGIPLSQAPWISYGSDTMLFHPDKKNRDELREKYNISASSFLILYAGKLDESKGGLFLASGIKEKFNTNRDIIFIIVGNVPNDQYGEKVDSEIALSKNIILRFPTQKYTELAKFFQIADLVVFPKQCSLSFYDVQACAVPVLFEDNNINIERCSHNNGMVFISGDMNDFRHKIEYFANMPLLEHEAMCKASLNFIQESYDYSVKADEYLREIQKAYELYKTRK